MSSRRAARRPRSGQPRAPHRSWPLVAVVLLALVVRAAGIRWGLPDGTHFFSFHPDEFETAARASRILGTGNWDPDFFNYGSLFLYLTTILAWPFHALGMIQTVTGAHVIARVVSILAGTGTVLLTERIARRFLPRMLALVAALFVALAPAHVQHSAFATVDVTATFFVALAIHLALRSGARHFALAGAAAGLAAGTKYSAGVVLLAPLAAIALAPASPLRQRLARAGLATACALAAFVIAVPFALINPDRFRADVSFELFVHPRIGHEDYFLQTGDGWSYHLLANLPYALGPPALLLSLAGVVLLVRRHRAAEWVLLAFALPYFAMIGSSQVRFLRYVLPLVPVLAVAAAVALDALRERGARGERIARIAGGAALAYSALLVLIQLHATLRPDPRTRAAQWIASNVPQGATLGLPTVPWFATPPVTPWNGGERSRSRFEAEPSPWRFALCEKWDLAALERTRTDVFVLSEFDTREATRVRNPEALRFLATLESNYVEAARFGSVSEATRWLYGRAFAPHDWLYPFSEIRILVRPHPRG